MSTHENPAPAGSESRALLPETRSGVGGKATTCHGSEAALPDQGTGELSALVRQWEKEAADGRAMADEMGSSLMEIHEGLRDLAAVCERHARELLAALSEPRPQSAADGDESCARCKGSGRVWPVGSMPWVCPDCQGTGSRKERSVSGNGASFPPATPERSESHD